MNGTINIEVTFKREMGGSDSEMGGLEGRWVAKIREVGAKLWELGG
jgi:hypothetical protein